MNLYTVNAEVLSPPSPPHRSQHTAAGSPRARRFFLQTAGYVSLHTSLWILSVSFLFESNDEADFVMDEIVFAPDAGLLAGRGFTLVKWEDGGRHNIYARQPLKAPHGRPRSSLCMTN